ncbi:MAG: YitT family protein [Anaerolineales bacterium]
MLNKDSAETENSQADVTRRLNWRSLLIDGGLLVFGALLAAFAINIFIAPHRIAPGGASGLAIILNSYLPIPLGLTMLAINIPAYYLGFRKLGGRSFLIRSLTSTLVYNLGVDLMAPYMPAGGVTDEMILNAIFGGVTLGIAIGFIYRGGGTAGAGGIINRMIQARWGLPFKVATLYTNSAIIGLAGLAFGWESAMYALISFYITGTVADFVLEGPAVVRTAMIITDRPNELAERLIQGLGRGVTRWTVEGMYTNEPHAALYCTVTRPQIHTLKQIVGYVDPGAFVIVGQGHEALGRGFRELSPQPPVIEEIHEG